MNTFLLEIVTPDHLVFAKQVNSLTVRGIEGDLGILPGHVPLVTPLQVAPMTIKSDAGVTTVAVHGGFIEVHKDKVTVLAESAELPSDIDLERAEAAKERAQRRLQSRGKQDDIDHRRAELALQRAVTRIKVSAGKGQK
ncbi:F0F1 ATP synthase subunit epsilon [Paenibacillus sp. 7124]|uniref:ATP synthase epsilon chain n=2 Tax=Paenibacillus TaxID=44249 RepID=A0A6M1PIV8_9BACL|nr:MULTISPECIES: F0F1 ATP synthase subunit epsilon [Paenibacillus]AHV99383.1 F0F1 ATP synthase subunit epsilon [Paenibacillus sabinae T27]NGM82275.1 F0F1 ATP synthase subunit epsilon [Paenibacillus apii]NJJ39412.1 F0F1 ATP synthase subunit epsilon [Paenibacillus apii]